VYVKIVKSVIKSKPIITAVPAKKRHSFVPDDDRRAMFQ